MTFEVCRFCSYSPCMCGRRDYGTERENRLKDQIDQEKRKDDEWALPPKYGPGCEEDDE